MNELSNICTQQMSMKKLYTDTKLNKCTFDKFIKNLKLQFKHNS